MKSIKIAREIVVFLLVFQLSLAGRSQTPYQGVASILMAGQQDASLIFNEYFTPLGKAWAADLSTSWYTQAKAHEPGGFDLMFSYQLAQIPDVDLQFDASNLILDKLYSTETFNEAPSILNGELTHNFNMNLIGVQPYFEEDITLKGFDIPNGLPLPIFNAGFGLFSNTELRARLIPQVQLGDFGNLNLWGFGFKHDFLQWIPGSDAIPIDASVMAAYSRLKMGITLDYQPTADLVEVELPTDQEFRMTMNSITANLIVSKRILFLTPYASAGITNNSFTMNLLGTYYFPLPDPATGLNSTIIQDSDEFRMIDPIEIKPDLGLQSQFVLGLRLNLAVFTLYGQYSIQEYNVLSGGIGISFN